MQAVFLNTFYAENLSGASYAVNKRLELFLRHQVVAKVMTTKFYLTNRYFFEKHFPNQKSSFLEFIDVLTSTIQVPEKKVLVDENFFNKLGFLKKMNIKLLIDDQITLLGQLIQTAEYSKCHIIIEKEKS